MLNPIIVNKANKTTSSELRLLAAHFVCADLAATVKKRQKRKYVCGAFKSLATAKPIEQIRVSASIELTLAYCQGRTDAFSHLATLAFVGLSMSSQSTSSRPSRKASQHQSGYYSQVADVTPDDVPAQNTDDDADDARGTSKRRTKSKPMQLDPENQVCEIVPDADSRLTSTGADSPDDELKKHGEKPNFAEVDGKKQRLAFHAWEAAWRIEMARRWKETETTLAQRNADYGALQLRINQCRQINGEQLVTVAQIQTAIRNKKAETKNQDFELLPLSLPSADALAGETTAQLLKYVDC